MNNHMTFIAPCHFGLEAVLKREIQTRVEDRLSDMLNLPVRIMENPQDHVARGCCLVASDNRLAQHLQQTGCLIEL